MISGSVALYDGTSFLQVPGQEDVGYIGARGHSTRGKRTL
jgi:hypothetical protein